MHHQQIRVTSGEHARTNTDRRHRKKSIRSGFYRVRQLHAAHVVVLRSAEHAGFGVSAAGILGGLRQYDFFTVEVGLLRVYQPIKRGVFFTRNALAGIKNRIKGFA